MYVAGGVLQERLLGGDKASLWGVFRHHWILLKDTIKRDESASESDCKLMETIRKESAQWQNVKPAGMYVSKPRVVGHSPATVVVRKCVGFVFARARCDPQQPLIR